MYPKKRTLVDISEEVARARSRFPNREKLLAALVEEVGEVARAMLECEGGGRVYAEASQVACLAIRIMEEGDSDFDSWEPA